MSPGPLSTSPENAFGLGMDLEELYSIFGEHIQIASGGLDAPLFDVAERKLARARDVLLAFQVSFPVVQRVESVSSYLEHAGRATLDIAATNAVATEISSLMGDIRDELDAGVGSLYDCGVMAARLALCLRALRASSDRLTLDLQELAEIYRRELGRVAPILREMIAVADQGKFLAPPAFRSALLTLGNHLDRYDGGSPEWRQSADVASDRVFESIAAIEVTGLPPPTNDREDVVAALVARRSAAATDGEPLRSIAALRELLADCQQALGDDDHLTLGVYGDLAMTHVRTGQTTFGADLALDAAERSDRTHGRHHPGTAYLYVRAVLARMADDRDAGTLLLRDRLGWLVTADPDALAPDLRVVRTHLFDLFGWKDD